jgi:hypothetical protein
VDKGILVTGASQSDSERLVDPSVQHVQEFNEAIKRIAEVTQGRHLGLSSSGWAVLLGLLGIGVAWWFELPALIAAGLEAEELSFWNLEGLRQFNFAKRVVAAKSAVVLGTGFVIHNALRPENQAYDFPSVLFTAIGGALPLGFSTIGAFLDANRGFHRGVDYGSSIDILADALGGDILHLSLDFLSKDVDKEFLGTGTVAGNSLNDMTSLERSIFAGPPHPVFGDPQTNSLVVPASISRMGAPSSASAVPTLEIPIAPPSGSIPSLPPVSNTRTPQTPIAPVPPSNPSPPQIATPSTPQNPVATRPPTASSPGPNAVPAPSVLPSGQSQAAVVKPAPNVYGALLPDYLGGNAPSQSEMDDDNDAKDLSSSEGLDIAPPD